jgi:predicted alpha/beta superfamily hydrolase
MRKYTNRPAVHLLLGMTFLLPCSMNVLAKGVDVDGVGIISKHEVMHSTVLKEDRTLRIHLPRDYQASKSHYPVLFILDAEQGIHFQRSVEILESLADREELPRLIIVGIENTNRLRDMNAVTFEYDGQSIVGGSDKFLSFIQTEVIAFVDKNYRTSNFRILFGRSASAAFSIFAMVSAPGAFDAYIASSPSFYVNNEIIRVRTRTYFASKSSFDRIFFMNLGTDDSINRIEQTRSYAGLLDDIAPSEFKWELKVMHGEGHVPITSLEDGLQMIFGEHRD